MLRWVPAFALLWLAWFFARTLRPGSMALIERICRRALPQPSATLVRYTRALTLVWCAYFLAAACAAVLLEPRDGATLGAFGAFVWTGTIVLFVGEWALRKLFFPGIAFPGLVQQLRDTWSVWRPGAASLVTGGGSEPRVPR